jgi:hypothetical protein
MLGMAAGLVAVGWSLYAFQDRFREYPGWEYNDSGYNPQYPVPTDYRDPGEWTFARLMYPSSRIQID